jgi:hypothetical protein
MRRHILLATILAALPGLASCQKGQEPDAVVETRLVYQLRAPDFAAMPPDATAAKQVIMARIDPDGQRGYAVHMIGHHRLQIILPGPPSAEEVARVKRLVAQNGLLEFRIVADRDRDKANFDHLIRLKQAGRPSDSPLWRWYPLKKGWEWYEGGKLDAWKFVYVVDEKIKTVEVLVNMADGQDVTGRDLSRASATVHSGEPIVSFQIKPEAAARFAALTSTENRGRNLAVILEGVIQATPVLLATLSTGGIIEGYKDEREVKEVVLVLNSGQLAVSLGDPEMEFSVGPPAGASLDREPRLECLLTLQPPAGQTTVPLDLVLQRCREALADDVSVRIAKFSGEPDSSRSYFLVTFRGKSETSELESAATLAKNFADLLPKEARRKIQLQASKITAGVLLKQLDATRPPQETASVKSNGLYIPDEFRRYLGGTCIKVTVTPPMSLEELRRRFEDYAKDKHPDILARPYRVQGVLAAGVPGESNSFDFWVTEDFDGNRGGMSSPDFWSDCIRTSIGSQPAFVTVWFCEP